MRGKKRAASIVAAGVGWAGLTLEVFGMLPPPVDHVGRISAVLATAGTIRLMLWAHQRPIARAYELGYEMGRRDQMKDVNVSHTKASVTAIREIFTGPAQPAVGEY